jgi:hypothetical protein
VRFPTEQLEAGAEAVHESDGVPTTDAMKATICAPPLDVGYSQDTKAEPTGVDPFDAAALGAVGADGFVTIGPGVAAATPAVPALIPTIEPKLRIPAIPIRIQLGSQE